MILWAVNSFKNIYKVLFLFLLKFYLKTNILTKTVISVDRIFLY